MKQERQEVLQFISRFTGDGQWAQVIHTFTCGCCYWFARILEERFSTVYETEILYDAVMNHFAVRIAGRVYDIRGDVTDGYNWEPWSEFPDEIQQKRIIRDCVMF